MDAHAKCCSTCGVDLNGRKRIKNATGEYFCDGCWKARASAIEDSIKISTTAQISDSRPARRETDAESAGETNSVLSEGIPHENERQHGKIAGGDHFSSTELWLILGGAFLGLLIVGGVIYFTIGRNWWEDHHTQIILGLKDNAESLASKGRLADAKSKYDEIFGLIGDHTIRSSQLQQALQSAHENANDVASKLELQEQVRRDAEAKQRLEDEAREQAQRLAKDQEEAKQRDILERQQARKDAIENDSIIAALVDRAPYLEVQIRSSSVKSIQITVDMMVATGQMSYKESEHN